MADVSTLRLKKGSAKPLHGGHPWVFADAISGKEGPAPAAGDEVRVVDEGGACLGRGFYSPESAIAVRLLTRADVPLNDAFLAARIDEALRLRRDVLQLGTMNPLPGPLSLEPAAPPAPPLSQKDSLMLESLDQQILRIQSFASQYGMDAGEETAELRKRREQLLKNAGVAPSAAPLPAPARAPLTSIRMPEFQPTTAYRLINSEGDGLGGLTVDVYGEYLAVQLGTAGMDRRAPFILDTLEARLKPKAVLDRSDARSRQIEKLAPPKVGALRGTDPDRSHVVLEHGVQFNCDLRSGRGQKTGLYLDQRENRVRFGALAAGRDVLDVFCYSGAFTVHAARGGAKSLTLVESSTEALEMARANLELNKIDDADLVNAEWNEGFKHLREAGRQFGLIVLDPPKFAKSRENVSQALSGYRDLNAQAVRLLSPGGLLFTCSCSGNVSETDFERAVASGIRASGRRAVLLERRGAAPDHPIPPGFDQGRYLKCLVLQVV